MRGIDGRRVTVSSSRDEATENDPAFRAAVLAADEQLKAGLSIEHAAVKAQLAKWLDEAR